MARRAARSQPRPEVVHEPQRPAPVAIASAADRWAARGPLLAALLALAAYAPSLGGGFLYDDIHVVVDNRRIRDLGAMGTVLRYEPARPVLNLTWALNYAAGGLAPWTYHLVNVAIHAGNAALVASLFLWMARRSPRRETPGAALFAAGLFAVTPMAAETVAYVSSRSTALAALFGLGSLRLATRVLTQPSARHVAGALFLFALALGTKEEAAAIPLLLLLLDYFFVAGQRVAEMRRRLTVHAAFLALPLVGLVARRAATGAWLPAPAADRGLYLLTQVAAYPVYLLRWLLPFDPAFFREHPLAGWPPSAVTLAWIALFAAIAVSAVAWRRRWPEWSFAVAWMGAALLPSSSIVPLAEMVVDHRAYLGGAGLLFWLGGVLWRRGGASLAVIVLTVLAARAWHYEWVLGDPVRAWEDATRREPASADAHRALADAYAGRGDPRAMVALTTAVRLEPRDARSWANLGVLYAQSGRLEDAATSMRAAAAAAPGDARIHDNLGLILQARGQDDEAAAAYEAAAAANARLAQPRIRLAALLARRGQAERARALLDEAAKLEIDAEDARAIEALRAQLR